MAQSPDSLATRGTAERIMGAVAVMLAVLMVVLDMTVVNVALPHMMGALGATSDQITWVLTSYIVSSAVVIPLSGYLAERFGRQQVMLVSVAGFVIASALCGQATTLTQMVIARLLQGVFGASVIPVSQSIMVDMFDVKSRGKAMAIWGIGVLMGPILGPTVGGFITDHMGWPWVFYINVPIGVVNLALIVSFLEKSSPRPGATADWTGALLLALGVGALQMLLDRGNREGWFESHLIVVLALTSATSLALFLLRSFGRPGAVLRIELLRDRNLAAATFMILAFGIGMMSTIVLQPIFLEHLLDYPASTAGVVMAPRGIAVTVGMALVAALINRVEPRWLVLIGLSLAAAGSYAMTWYNLNIDLTWIILPGIVQGIGMGMIFVPLSTLAFLTLPAEANDQASSIFNLARTIGGAIGIALSATVLTRQSQESWAMLGARINPYDPALTDWLTAHGFSPSDPNAAAALAKDVTEQATMLGFLGAFHFVALSFLVLIPFVLLLSGTKGRGASAASGAQSMAH